MLYLFVDGTYVGEAYCTQLMGGRVSEWEARAMRKYDKEQEALARTQGQPAAQPKCTFHGEVPIDFEQFLESGVSLVECPDCTSTSALAPHKEILHFKPHKRRKTRSTSTEPRWAKREMIWAVVSK